MDPVAFGLFFAAVLVLNLTPGPDMLFSAACGMKGGSRAGLISAAGVASGALVHATFAAVGVTALLARSEFAYDLLRVAGALYLLWVGFKTFQEARKPVRVSTVDTHPSKRHLFFRGFLTNVINPKVGLFFIAFLPQFVDPTTQHLTLTIFLMGCFVGVSGLVVNGAVGVLAGRAGQVMSDRPVLRKCLFYLSGSLFVGLALNLFFMEKA
ncbi:LysE family translocator [Sneathiella aquimaris]|uniref:LysE family translocator n=1 Tax=Sneathiella aquimaris TaxID=2599305 RepID=UPI00146D2FFD|nr:LysE family translocator [Sneathiella aquimaris]